MHPRVSRFARWRCLTKESLAQNIQDMSRIRSLSTIVDLFFRTKKETNDIDCIKQRQRLQELERLEKNNDKRREMIRSSRSFETGCFLFHWLTRNNQSERLIKKWDAFADQILLLSEYAEHGARKTFRHLEGYRLPFGTCRLTYRDSRDQRETQSKLILIEGWNFSSNNVRWIDTEKQDNFFCLFVWSQREFRREASLRGITSI